VDRITQVRQHVAIKSNDPKDIVNYALKTMHILAGIGSDTADNAITDRI
jgi:hypothetical protein